MSNGIVHFSGRGKFTLCRLSKGLVNSVWRGGFIQYINLWVTMLSTVYCVFNDLCFFFWFMNISTNLLVMKNEKWKLQQYNLWSSNPGHTRISVYDIHHEWSIETPDSRFWLTDYSSLTFYLTQHLKNYSMMINTWHLNVVVEFEVIIFIFFNFY